MDPHTVPSATLVPLGDSALLVRFGEGLSDAANAAAITLAKTLDQDPMPGVQEVVPNLVSVLLRYDPFQTSAQAISGELRLRIFGLPPGKRDVSRWSIPVVFDGPDLPEAAAALGLSEAAFVAEHNQSDLRVLATGFAPGFVYCGLHPNHLLLPRRLELRTAVPPGSVLFAAGQTAITATEMPTGWHIIGHTQFINFDSTAHPPTRLAAGDHLRFEVAE